MFSTDTESERERERERASDVELELWVFLLVRNKSGSWGASSVVWGAGGGLLIFPSSQVLRIRGSGSRF
jgi:hypothetical protein